MKVGPPARDGRRDTNWSQLKKKKDNPKRNHRERANSAASMPVRVALDFTIITPTMASSATRVTTESKTTLMDQAAEQKNEKCQNACRAAFVADTCGALLVNAREFVKRVLSATTTRCRH